MPGRQVLVFADERNGGAGIAGAGKNPSGSNNNYNNRNRNALLALKSGADAWVTGASNPRESLIGDRSNRSVVCADGGGACVSCSCAPYWLSLLRRRG